MYQRGGRCPRQRQKTCRSGANSSNWSECTSTASPSNSNSSSSVPHIMHIYTRSAIGVDHVCAVASHRGLLTTVVFKLSLQQTQSSADPA
jgi:hypothetical protein